MYQVLIERSAEKDLNKITAEERPKLTNAMRALANEPRPTGCRKLVGSENDWRVRVGNYEISDEVRIVRIQRIRHRKDSYR